MAGTARRRRAQRGQAIVLIAMLLVAACGIVALAIDGGRLYVERRDLQDAVDAAALGAADTWLNGHDYVQAEQQALSLYAVNQRLYGTYSCTPALAAPAAATSSSFSCPFTSTQHTVTLTVNRPAAGGGYFTVAAQKSVSVAIAAVLNGQTSQPVGATATSLATVTYPVPALLTLSQDCSTSLQLSGTNSQVTIGGDLVTDGGLSAATGQVIVSGNAYQSCSGTPNVTLYCGYPSDQNFQGQRGAGGAPPCTAPMVLGTKAGSHTVTSDPAFTPPSTAGLVNKTISGNVISPGIYSASPGASCYFLEAGVYDWTSGITGSGGFVSNELKPPDEPVYNNNQQRASPQFWDTNSACSGTFTPSASAVAPAVGLPVGVYGVEVTSMRTDTYKGVSFTRESAPSMCKTVTIGANQGIQLSISNVPGAQSYGVYIQPPPANCGGPFGYVSSLSNPAYGGASLGTTTGTVTSTQLPSGFAPSAAAAPDSPGAYPPDGETAPAGSGLPNGNPAIAAPPHGDRANEGQCATSAGVSATCHAAVTPGAVEWYMPTGSCLSMSGRGDIYTFSGDQYAWVAIYQPGALYPPANTCANVLAGNSNSTVLGITYMPSASITITGNGAFQAPADGGVVAYQATINGNGGVTINSSGRSAPPAPAAVLTT